MKSLRYLGLIICSLLVASCEKETEDVSNVNKLYFEIQGDETMLVTLGSSYNEPGYKATFNGVDVTKEIKVLGDEVDAQTVGVYNKEYAFYNKDNVKTSLYRTVIVCDPTVETDISGTYKTTDATAIKTTNYPGCTVRITKIAPGFFRISDFFGGFYAEYRGYGASYACSGNMQLKNDNTLTLLSSSILPWGDTVSSVTDAVYNPADGTISWVTAYVSGMTFNVELKK